MTKSSPVVSVVMATYNMAEYLGKAIESVLQQSYSDLELLIIDDGSTDNTENIVSNYLGDKRVVYVRQPNAGQASAKNHGVRIARGSFIGFCDADDYWKSDKIRLQLDAFDDDKDVGVIYSRIAQTKDGVHEEPWDMDRKLVNGRITEALFLHNFISFGTALVRRECFERLGAFNEKYRMGIDWDLWLRFSTHYDFRFVDEVTCVYRVWDGQMSMNWRGRYEFTFAIMRDFLAEFPDAVAIETVRQAYADSYVQRGRLRSSLSNEHLAGIRDVLNGIRRKPASVYAWKSLLRIALNAVGIKERRIMSDMD